MGKIKTDVQSSRTAVFNRSTPLSTRRISMLRMKSNMAVGCVCLLVAPLLNDIVFRFGRCTAKKGFFSDLVRPYREWSVANIDLSNSSRWNRCCAPERSTFRCRTRSRWRSRTISISRCSATRLCRPNRTCCAPKRAGCCAASPIGSERPSAPAETSCWAVAAAALAATVRWATAASVPTA